MSIQYYQKLTLLDFPGRVACTVFFHGCNFRCPFCHNPALVIKSPGEDRVDREGFFDFLKSREGVLEGVAITGGEPLMTDEIIGFAEDIKKAGFAVKIDTNGYYPERLGVLIENGCADYYAMDIKNSPELYAETVGRPYVDMSRIEKSISLLIDKAPDYEFRTTVIKEFHTEKSLIGAAGLIKGAKRYFLQNFKDSGELVGDGGYSSYKREELEAMLNNIRKIIPNTELRGI